MKLVIRTSLVLLGIALVLGGIGNAAVPIGPIGMSQDPGLVMADRWIGPSEELMTGRILLHESGFANLTELAGGDGCAVPQDDVGADPNPDTVFTALFTACCRICSTGKACGDSCIARSLTCHKGFGCACDAAAPQPTTVTVTPITAAPTTRLITPAPTPLVTSPPLATRIALTLAPTPTYTAAVSGTDQAGSGPGAGWIIGGIAAVGAGILYRRRRR